MYKFDKDQEEYFELLRLYKNIVTKDNLSISEICYILDDIKIFWLKKSDVIQFKLEKIPKDKTCYLLSGSIFLNVEHNEHYYFISMGDYNFLPDPFEKIENFYRLPTDILQIDRLKTLFKDVYSDTLEVLTKYQEYFSFLPINEIIHLDDEEEQINILRNISWNFLSQILTSNIDTEDEYYASYKTFEDIEKDLDDFVLDHLLFNNLEDRHLSLRERINHYQEQQNELIHLFKEASEAKQFMYSLYSLLSQTVDILFQCSALGLSPYIRSEITINYLMLMRSIIAEQPQIREIVENAIIFYCFYKTVRIESITKYNFQKYCSLVSKEAILLSVRELITENNINVLTDSLQPIISLIESHISDLTG